MSESEPHHLGEEEPAAEVHSTLPPPPPPPPVPSKRTAWTEDEHSLFLKGVNEHGKGNWNIIARDFVKSKSPTQIAKHSHGYFLRQNVVDKKRRSINDTAIEKIDQNSLPRRDASPSSSRTRGDIPSQHQENDDPKDALYVDMTIQKFDEGRFGIFLRDSDSDHLKIQRIVTLPATPPLLDVDFSPQKWIPLPYPFSTDFPPQNYRVFLEMLQHKPSDGGTNVSEIDLNELPPESETMVQQPVKF